MSSQKSKNRRRRNQSSHGIHVSIKYLSVTDKLRKFDIAFLSILLNVLIVKMFVTGDIPLYSWSIAMYPTKMLHFHGLVGFLLQFWMYGFAMYPMICSPRFALDCHTAISNSNIAAERCRGKVRQELNRRLFMHDATNHSLLTLFRDADARRSLGFS